MVGVGTFLWNLYLMLHKLRTSRSLRGKPSLTHCNVPLPLNTAYRYMHIWVGYIIIYYK